MLVFFDWSPSLKSRLALDANPLLTFSAAIDYSWWLIVLSRTPCRANELWWDNTINRKHNIDRNGTFYCWSTQKFTKYLLFLWSEVRTRMLHNTSERMGIQEPNYQQLRQERGWYSRDSSQSYEPHIVEEIPWIWTDRCPILQLGVYLSHMTPYAHVYVY